MKKFDLFIFTYRYYIGGALIAIIIVGLSLIGWERWHRTNSNNENQIITELKTQNDLLRQQLAQLSSGQMTGSATSGVAEIGDKININTADAATLDKLPGIGPARAADIINYRQTNGGFKSIEELKNIKGVGDKTFESLKDLVTVGG